MTDRELLELAAKAAGYAIHALRQADRDRDYPEQIGLWIPSESTCWNPLIDSGHALRLAVKLAIDIHLFPSVGWKAKDDHHWMRTLVDREGRAFNEHTGTDPYAATRRAIVRAAAALASSSTEGAK